MKPIICLFLGALLAFPAVTLDTSAALAYNGSGTATYSYTTSGANRVLVVCVWGDSTDTTTGITYGGASMTLILKAPPFGGSGASNDYRYCFGIINPAVGANNIVVTTTNQLTGSAISFDGANQSSLPDASALDTGNTPATNTNTTAFPLVTVAANSWLVGWMSGGGLGSATLTAGTGTVLRQTSQFNTGVLFDSGATVASGSNNLVSALTGTGGTSYPYSTIMLSVAPAVAAAAAKHHAISQ